MSRVLVVGTPGLSFQQLAILNRGSPIVCTQEPIWPMRAVDMIWSGMGIPVNKPWVFTWNPYENYRSNRKKKGPRRMRTLYVWPAKRGG